jgi:hypothetical protein
MNQQATVGTNRTGIAAAPQRSQEMLTGMEEFPPTSEGSAQDIALVRIAYAQEAEPLGSVPLPAGRVCLSKGGNSGSDITIR